MKNFELWNPTRLVFGENRIEEVNKHIPADAKNIMVLFGGGSVKKNGIYDLVHTALKDRNVIDFGGIEANPRYETIMKARTLAIKENVDFLLAVGGGSVIDATKLLCVAIPFTESEPWDIIKKGLGKKVTEAVPFGTILTLPATGSEMNSGSVVTREETKEKLAFGGPLCFPKFSILDPRVVASLPQRQIVNGITDAFTHVLEQYITYPADAPLQDRIAEGVLQTLVEIGPQVIANPGDSTVAGNFMWCCTMALNGLIQQGVPTDWATHMIGHELTALYEIDHARTLAIIGPNLYRVMFNNKKDKLAQYGERVWGITEGSIEHRAQATIERTVEFFHSMGIDTKISDYTEDYAEVAKTIVDRFADRKWLGLGERQDISLEKVQEIVEMSI
ncbi:iron-containing alcohol dehydrogenase [Flammeovirga pectinis]|uniref:Iron-containing alcohol dehydrogenase n=1 Tax=Flammeovirga pectinis TaxID=2494373 RepID=A0A3Q9FTU6_9BACT|nr:iron-containing alcohol dehydrogenase [Flammeovirga pectinis]AZQ64503.1 iron-containing alcohol dehydrogenase [Flammeovirga pectinis]